MPRYDRDWSYGPEYEAAYGGRHDLEFEDYGYEFGGRGWPYHDRAGYTDEHWQRYGRARDRGSERWPPFEDLPGYATDRWPPFGEGEGYGRRRARRGPRGEHEGGRPFPRGHHYMEPRAARREPRCGRSPSDRWPAATHYSPRPDYERRLRDEEVRDIVYEHLYCDEWVNPDRIEVEVRDGVVVLHGEVDDFMEARYVWDDAWESPGVRGVINNLTVRTDAPHRDMRMPQTGGR